MSNFVTLWIDGVTQWLAASLNPALSQIDKAITYATKSPIVHCDGSVTWAAGTLTWDATIRILFVSAAGLTIQNTIAAGNIALSDNEFAYVDLSETNDQALTMQKASVTTGSASNFVTLARLVMGYRNTTNDEFYAVWMPIKLSALVAPDLTGYVAKATYDAQSILAAVSDNTPVAVTVAEQRIVGRKTGGNIAALTGAEVLTLVNGMQAGQQSITCADSVNIDWTAGSTAYMTFDRASVDVTLSNPVNGQVYRFLLAQDVTGGRVLTWTTTVKWRGGSAPTLTATGSAIDILTLVYINGAWYGDIAANFA